jgi:hypothetical protein
MALARLTDGQRGRRLQVELLEDRALPTIAVSGATAQQLVQNLVGVGVKVSNVSFTGAGVAAGTFTGGTSAVGFDSGIILSSGKATDVAPPESFFASTANGTPGDAQLAALAGVTLAETFDAASLEFDFVPKGSTLTFNYVFGSEEYPDFAPPNSSTFNDVFGFFLNGTNVALLPNGQAVSVNNVNVVTNSQFFVNNAANGMDLGPQIRDTSLDGLTTVLTVTAHVNPGVSNHIKLAICDTGDAVFDSDVFIQGGSFNAGAFLGKVFYPFRYVFDAKTQTYRGNLTALNTDTDPALGPFFFVLPKLPKGVTLVNASGTTSAGAPFVRVNVGLLPPGKSVRVPLVFSNPLRKPLSTFFFGFQVLVAQGANPP